PDDIMPLKKGIKHDHVPGFSCNRVFSFLDKRQARVKSGNNVPREDESDDSDGSGSSDSGGEDGDDESDDEGPGGDGGKKEDTKKKDTSKKDDEKPGPRDDSGQGGQDPKPKILTPKQSAFQALKNIQAQRRAAKGQTTSESAKGSHQAATESKASGGA
ncbi:hypothetical protein BGW39_008408, partial [Mortierella sp. 14UC]